jgi:LacI family transcriptional regulator
MADLGYRPHAAARGMRGQTYTIGVMVPDIRNPFFADILDGLGEWLQDTDYQVLLGAGRHGEDAEARLTDAMVDRRMDGIVLIAPLAARAELDRLASLVPTVVVGRHARSARYDAVNDDDHAGAALVVDHLADLGHRRIAHIDHHETNPDRLAEMPNAIRAEGYRDAMRARGLADHIDVVATSYTRDGGYRGTKQLLSRRERPTAIFAGADFVAMGVLDAVAEAGLRVPEDISLAGYDNTTFAAFSPISLTSVDQAGRQNRRPAPPLGADPALPHARRAHEHRAAGRLAVMPRTVADAADGWLAAQ